MRVGAFVARGTESGSGPEVQGIWPQVLSVCMPGIEPPEPSTKSETVKSENAT